MQVNVEQKQFKTIVISILPLKKVIYQKTPNKPNPKTAKFPRYYDNFMIHEKCPD